MTDLNGDLASAVSELCSGGLLVELRKEPEPSYRFRHSLIQEATYKALLREQRQRLHARAAWGLEEQWAGRLEELAGTLGHHFAMAGEPGRAVHYLEQAGDYAASAFANEEAVSSYRYALDILGNERGDSIRAWRATQRSTPKTSSVSSSPRSWCTSGASRWPGKSFRRVCGSLGTGDEDLAARLYNRLGRAELDSHEYDAALSGVRSGIGAVRDSSSKPGLSAPRRLARYPDGHGHDPLLAGRTRPDAGPHGRGSACVRHRGGPAGEAR